MNLEVIYKGKHRYNLSESLVRNKNLTQERVDVLKALHIEKLTLFDEMEATDDVETLRELAHSVKSVEFMIQEAWGFPKNSNFHQWFLVPKCICPQSDNYDKIGTKYRITNGNCPIHGGIK